MCVCVCVYICYWLQEDSEYVQSLGVTVEMMNKNIFRELIFAESFMSSNLPLIIAQLRSDYIHDLWYGNDIIFMSLFQTGQSCFRSIPSKHSRCSESTVRPTFT